MNKFIVIISFLLAQTRLLAGDEKNIIPTGLKSATVYRVGAELTHNAKAVLKQGDNDLEIEGLSNGLDISSIQIGSDQKLTIMSVEFATDFLKPAIKTASIKKLEDSLEIVNKEISKIQVMLKTDNELMEMLKANREIRGTQTGLSVAELMKMMDYYKTKSLET
ncbi:MAG: DUF4140 domain-containing protein, partial [Bacteroidota bacterium]